MASPIADSAADIASMQNTKICPTMSSSKTPNITKVKFKDISVSSTDISVIKKFFLLRATPRMPRMNIAHVRDSISYIASDIKLLSAPGFEPNISATGNELSTFCYNKSSCILKKQ